jgi:hypothetical protein
MDEGSWGQTRKKFLLLVGLEPAMATLVRRPLHEGIVVVTSDFLLLNSRGNHRSVDQMMAVLLHCFPLWDIILGVVHRLEGPVDDIAGG